MDPKQLAELVRLVDSERAAMADANTIENEARVIEGLATRGMKLSRSRRRWTYQLTTMTGPGKGSRVGPITLLDASRMLEKFGKA
jgi:hypothetical protein